MATIAVYSSKGGVGKTSIAVNLAWASASLSSRRTLLWDLDPQGASTYLLGLDPAESAASEGIFARDVDPFEAVRPTDIANLDILPADEGLGHLDSFFAALGKKRRMARVMETLAGSYDRIILDCPPGLTAISEQVARAADLIVAPVIPSPLARRALNDVIARFARTKVRHAPILPVFNMVDRRRGLHQAALSEHPQWPVIPMASAIEAMSAKRQPIGCYAAASPAAEVFARLWRGIERRLAG
ncbi:ParA family protein [Sphingomonas sp. ID0503]|uniref:ParA family protein n=1 Tax=Sphingomonas sp. ID0503 TaxID=3399691 RepID=UPI003AFABBA8